MMCNKGLLAGFITLMACALLALPSAASDHFDEQQSFIEAAFGETVPASKTLWLNKALKKDVAKIMGHKNFQGLRVRYHADGARTVWVLEEIGKYKPITVGIAVNDGAIEKLRVLAYRESHGWEVKQDFFTRQFIGAKLAKKWRLDEDIDGISGATLSVRALKKLARLALYFDGVVQNADEIVETATGSDK
jgi:Na+-translocating ferredoxin:NAD+ oxidoreductase RnfG subunit